MKTIIALSLALAIPAFANTGSSAAARDGGSPDTDRMRSTTTNQGSTSTNQGTTTTSQGLRDPANTTATNTASGTTSSAQSKTYKVSDLSCNGCETRVQNAVRKVPGVRSVTADASTGQVSVSTDGRTKIDEAAITRAIENEGFRVAR